MSYTFRLIFIICFIGYVGRSAKMQELLNGGIDFSNVQKP
ncbi:hypothetical protein CBN_1988 [Clostridium botulinum NCTC 2916]|nr:hypothetical protein CBN_1988 [Clostridium botulinum NCTC 2916]